MLVMWKSSPWPGKNIVRSTSQKNSRKAWIGAKQLISPLTCRKLPRANLDSYTMHVHYIPSSEILEFPSVINFDIITSDNINFHFTSCSNLGTTFFLIKHL